MRNVNNLPPVDPDPGRPVATKAFMSVALGITVALLGATGGGCASSPDANASETTAAPTDGRITVRAIPAAKEDVALDIYAAGTLVPIREVLLSPEVGGRVTRKNLALGRTVAAGETLVALSTTGLAATSEASRASLASASARLADARGNLASGRKLLAKKVISEKEMDALKLAVTLGEAEVNGLKANLRRLAADMGGARVKAPFAGVIASDDVEVGAVVGAGTPLGRLVDVSTVVVMVSISEGEVVRVREGLKVEVSLDVLDGRSFTGTLHAIAPVPDSRTRTYPVEIHVDNTDGALRAGMMARVRIPGEVLPDQVLVPREAILRRGDGDVVFTIAPTEEGGSATADRVTVKVTGRFGARVALDGLEPGAWVLTSGHTRVKDGVEVRLGSVELPSSKAEAAGGGDADDAG